MSTIEVLSGGFWLISQYLNWVGFDLVFFENISTWVGFDFVNFVLKLECFDRLSALFGYYLNWVLVRLPACLLVRLSVLFLNKYLP